MSDKFKKNIENFSCAKCGADVIGNGFTNHCPKCLWSKHVDIFPGDRKSNCCGLMELIGLEKQKNNYILTHKCLECGHEKRNIMAPNDDFDVAIKAVKQRNTS